MDEKQLAKAIKSGVKRLYYIYGNDRFVIDNCINGIASAMGVSPEIMDAKTADLESIGEVVYSFSMFGDKRLLVLDGFFVSAVGEERVKYIESLLPDIPDTICIVLRAVDPDEKRFSLPKRIEKMLPLPEGGGEHVMVMKRTGMALNDLIASLAKREGATIDSAAARRLSELRGEDTAILDGEIKKLAALSGYSNITIEMVDELCVRTVEAGVYDMLRVLERGDTKATLDILSDMLRQRTEPMLIAGTLNTAFINMARAKALKDRGRAMQDMVSAFSYSKTDRKVEIAWKQADRYSLSQLRKVINILYKLDFDLKSSRQDRGILTEVAVCGICDALSSGRGRRY